MRPTIKLTSMLHVFLQMAILLSGCGEAAPVLEPTATAIAMPPSPTPQPAGPSAFAEGVEYHSKETFATGVDETWVQENAAWEDGGISITGDGTWGSYLVHLDERIPNTGAAARFKFEEGAAFGIAMQHGEWGKDYYRDIGLLFNGTSPEAAITIGTDELETQPFQKNLILKPETWYQINFYIEYNGKFLITVWQEDKVTNNGYFLYTLDETSRDMMWRFTASVNQERLQIDSVGLFRFVALRNPATVALADRAGTTTAATSIPATAQPTALPTPIPVLFSEGALNGEIELLERYGLGTVFESEFSPDNSQIAYANQFGLYLYNTKENAIDLFLPSAPVHAVNFSPDGKWIAYGGIDGVVKVWDIEQGKEIASLQDSDAPIKQIVFSLDQATLLFRDNDGKLVVYSTGDWSFYKRHALGYIGDMQPLLDGTRLMVSAHNKGILGLDTNGWGLLNQYTTYRVNGVGHWYDSEGIAVTPDNNFVAVGQDHFPFFPILNLKTGQLESVVTIEPGGKVPSDAKIRSIHALKYIEDGKKLFFISDGGAGLIDVEDDYKVIEFSDSLKSYSPIKITMSNDEKEAAIGSGVFDLSQWKFTYPFYSAQGFTDETLVSVNPNDGKTLFREEAPLFESGNYTLEIDGETGEITLIDNSTGTALFSEIAHTPMPKRNVVGQTFYYALIKTAVMPDESVFITGGADKALKLWHTSSEPNMIPLGSLNSDADQILITPDSSKIFVSDSSGNLYMVDQTGTKKPTLLKRFDEIHALLISPDSTRLAVKDKNGVITIYSLKSDLPEEIVRVKPSITYASATKLSNFVLFTPDSKVLVSAVRDQVIDILNVEDGQLLGTIEFPERIYNMQFSEDGTRLNIQGSSIQVWGTR